MTRLIAFSLLFLSLSLQAQQVEVRGARIWTGPDETRLVVDTTASVSHRIFPLDDPHRLVIDIPNARLTGKLPTVKDSDPMVVGIRSGIQDGYDLRLVLDLERKVRAKSFLLQPNGKYGHRLVVDLTPPEGREVAQSIAKGGSREPSLGGKDKGQPAKSSQRRDVVVAIDAGHGGEDSGAVGTDGTYEKDITLQIARRLARLIDEEPGMRPVLIRDGDYFIPLRKRITLARKHEADLFISIHADAFHDRRVRGSSVYTLSQSGASSEAAKWLADKENSADLIGGIDLAENNDVMTKVLLEMSQNGALEHSNLAAREVLANLGRLGAVHKTSVQKAGFVVLKSPNIPSMLVETAFITNPEEEERLRSGRYQARLAEAIMSGIEDYFVNNPPPNTKLAAGGGGEGRRHVIHRGDTLSEIAEQYNVSLASLRTVNHIEGDRIRIGQVLTIPGG